MLVLIATVLGGCVAQPTREIKRLFTTEGEPILRRALRHYNEGRLVQASEYLQEALDAGLTEANQLTAHKHLAFINCLNKRERQCRAHFTIALEIDPAFELDAAEAQHPAWGGHFRAVKSKRRRVNP